MAKKYKPFIVKPVLTRRCKKCGKIFAACHPKDPQEYCENCRKDNDVRSESEGR